MSKRKLLYYLVIPPESIEYKTDKYVIYKGFYQFKYKRHAVRFAHKLALKFNGQTTELCQVFFHRKFNKKLEKVTEFNTSFIPTSIYVSNKRHRR